MNNSFAKIVNIIIATIVIFVFPILYFSIKQDTLTQNVLSQEANRFVDTVSTKGYITKDMYETFLSKIDATGIISNVEFESREYTAEPEYIFKSVDNVRNEQDSTYTGTNDYNYIPVTTDKPIVVDPVDNSGLVMNTETNASIIAKAVNKPASPTHVHSDACYLGTKHTHVTNCYTTTYHYHSSSCYTSSYHYHWSGCYTTHSHTSSCYTSVTCSNCGGSGWDYDSSPEDPTNATCGSCGGSGRIRTFTCTISISPTLSCGYSDGEYLGTYVSCGYYNGQATGSYLSCGKTAGKYYNGNTEVALSCHSQISGITVTNPIQTLYINDPLITTIVITYLDGSTKTVAATADSNAGTITQNKTVVLSYGGVTATIKITVIPKTKTCINGHIYNLNNNGSDPGCIYCDSWLNKLEIVTPSNSILKIYKGSSLEANGVIVRATYMNGRTELLYNGYVHNLDKNYIGTQKVTIGYKGLTTMLDVTVKRNLTQCSKCGRDYDLYPDNTDPGCPYCVSKIPVFTGEVLKYYRSSYLNEIMKELYEGSGIFYFKKGDYLTVNISNKSKTLSGSLLDITLPGLPSSSISVSTRSIIRNATVN